MDLQQKSWLLEVRTVGAGSVDGWDKLWLSPETPLISDAAYSRDSHFSQKMGEVGHPLTYRFDWPRANFLTLRFFDPRA